VVKLVRNRKALQTTIFSIYFALMSATLGLLPHFKGEKPMDIAIGQQAGASIVLLPLAGSTFSLAIPSFCSYLVSTRNFFFMYGGRLLILFCAYSKCRSVKGHDCQFLIPYFRDYVGSYFSS
jgi:hypothetical protein